MANAPQAPAGRPLGLLLALAACLVLLAGYFLPWASLTPKLERVIGISRAQVRAEAEETGDSARAEKARRLAEGSTLTGAEWASVLGLLEDDADLTERQRRVAHATAIGVVVVPFAAAALALLLLLMLLQPRMAFKAGLGPVALVVGPTRVRGIRYILLVLVMTLGLVVGAVGLLVWLVARGAEQQETVALGIKMISVGGLAAFLGSFFGYGRGRLRGLIGAVVLLVAITGVVYYYTSR